MAEQDLDSVEQKSLEEIFQNLSNFKSKQDFWSVFRDICTLAELKAIAERWEVAKALHQGMSYREVSKKLGVSTTTVTRVAHWMEHGRGGYSLLLQRQKVKS